MPVNGVYQNIEGILQRIDQIRRRFGVSGSGGSAGGRQSFARKLEQAQRREDAAPAQEALTAGNPAGGGATAPGAPAGTALDAVIGQAAERFGIPEALIRAVIRQESGFEQSAVSAKGAMGLMQLMPDTAAMMGVHNPFDAAQNILGGTRYLRGLLDLYGGNLNNALAAYNAGPGQVRDRVPDIPETRSFVDAVLDTYRRYENGEER